MSQSIEQVRNSLKEFISDNIIYSNDDKYIELVQHCINLANRYMAKDKKTEALHVMRICAGMTLNQYVSMPFLNVIFPITDTRLWFNQYHLGVYYFEPLYKIYEWYKEVLPEEGTFILEKAYFNSRMQVASSPWSGATRALVYYLMTGYLDNGQKDKAIQLLGEIFEFGFRYPLPASECDIPLDEEEWHGYFNLLKESKLNSKIRDTKASIKNWPNSNQKTFKNSGPYSKIRKSEDGFCAVGIQLNSSRLLWGFTDPSDKLIVQPTYNEASCFNEGLALVGISSLKEGEYAQFGSIGMKYGYINYTSDIVIPIEYDYASLFYQGEALVAKDGEFFYINTLGIRTRQLKFRLSRQK